MVDVNVHPRKEEVKFVNSASIFNLVKQSVNHALQKDAAVFTFSKPFSSNISARIQSQPQSSFFTPANILPKIVVEAFPNIEIPKSIPSHSPEILQIHQLYLVIPTIDGVTIIDQHAAHERILYEKFLSKYKNEASANTQSLLISQTLELSPSEFQLFKEYWDTLTKLGFEIDAFGKNSIKVNSIPQELTGKNISQIIKEVLSDLWNEKSVRNVDLQNLKILTYLACRSAVMAGDMLLAEMKKYLVETLPLTPNNATCPHGRPTRIEFSKNQLDKMFKRV